MLSVRVYLPIRDAKGQMISIDHHVQFLEYVAEIFAGSRFIGTEHHDRVLLIEDDGGLVRHSVALKGLAVVAKLHYSLVQIRFEYHGFVETL